MPEVGRVGQEKLHSSSVLVVGAGGLGSPIGLYLAAAGIGTIGIVDFDTVELSNLQRQVVHSTNGIGRTKTESARDRLLSLNPNIDINVHQTRLTSKNALDIIGQYDIVADGTDDFPTRYLINDACVLLGKTDVYGSVFRFEGQVSVFASPDGPCYRCLYPQSPSPGLVPGCAEGGVLGVLPGIVGTIQATEVIKMLLGIGDSLVGRMLLIDALSMKFQEVRVPKNPDCPLCGKNPTIHSLSTYEVLCGMTEDIFEISVEELKHRLESKDIFLLDVREQNEYDFCNIGGTLIPLAQLPSRIKELDSSLDIAVLCRTGRRSQRAVEELKKAGFKKVKNIVGGIDAWAQKIDPSVPRY